MAKIRKRRIKDNSQAIRSAFQVMFLLLNVWIGFQFLIWVWSFENGGSGWHLGRPPGVEGWLPIASLMNLKAWLLTGDLPSIHPAGLFLLIAFLTISFLVRKAFCSWLCPIGTLSEVLWKSGKRFLKVNWRPPGLLDIPLRSLKYLLLGLFLYAILLMPVDSIRAFLEGPYGMVADVKMLNFFRFISLSGVIVISVLMVFSLLIKNFWCRYLCPYGALMGLAAALSPLRIQRNPNLCVECGKCSKACPSMLPVDQLVVINSLECSSCYECVASCPAEDALEYRMVGQKKVKPWLAAAAISVIFLGFVIGARITGNWNTELPDRIYQELVPKAEQYSHP